MSIPVKLLMYMGHITLPYHYATNLLSQRAEEIYQGTDYQLTVIEQKQIAQHVVKQFIV